MDNEEFYEIIKEIRGILSDPENVKQRKSKVRKSKESQMRGQPPFCIYVSENSYIVRRNVALEVTNASKK